MNYDYSILDTVTIKVPSEHYGEIRYAFDYFNRERDPRVGEVFEMQNFINMTSTQRCFIDIGSLFGIFSFVFTRNASSIAYAIEPSEGCVKILKNIIDLNPQHDVKYVQTMLGDVNGSVNVGHDWMHLIVSNENTGEHMTVETLDSMVARLDITPDTLKIDTEGYEVRILQGGRETISKFKPLIFLEAHHNMVATYGNTMKELGELITDLGYDVFDFHLGYRPNFEDFIASQFPHPVTRMLLIPQV